MASPAAKALLKEVGKPHNAHTIDIAALRTLKRWLEQDDAERAELVAQLAAELDAIRTSKDFAEFEDSAWNIHRRFNDMIAIARVVDVLIRPRLPLAETTLVALARFSTVRYRDYSLLRLVAQLEHYGKTVPITGDLHAALLELAGKWHDEKVRNRINWLTSPAQPERARAEAAKPKKKRA